MTMGMRLMVKHQLKESPMKTSLRMLTVLAASSLAAIAYAQTQPAPSTQPNAAPGYNTAKPHQSQITTAQGNEAASPSGRSAPGSALNTGQSQTRSGSLRTAASGSTGRSWSHMAVESSSGQSLGSVSRVVPGLNGKTSSGYVVVSGSNGESVPVPYGTATSMVRDGKLILSQSRLEQAPKVTQDDLRTKSSHAWRGKADHYWMRKGTGQHAHKRS
jgi:hypothetical protein